MTKVELVNRIATEVGLDTPHGRYTVDRAIEGFLAVVSDELAQGNQVRLTGFGKFQIIQRKQSKRRNPKTGDIVVVPSRRAVSFHAAPKLTGRVNELQTVGSGD